MENKYELYNYEQYVALNPSSTYEDWINYLIENGIDIKRKVVENDMIIGDCITLV